MSMLVTVVEKGDIIIVHKDPWSGRTEDSTYYIIRDDKLVEVPWYEASEYQTAFNKRKSTHGTDQQAPDELGVNPRGQHP